jgi:hypothetical protein
MSFLWSTAKPTEAPASEAKGKVTEFDDLLNSKDLELQAILGGAPSADDASKKSGGADTNPYVNLTVEGGTISSKEVTGPSGSRGSKARAKPGASPAAAAAAAAQDTKLASDQKLFGVPRNYVVVVAMALIMGGFLFQYMGDVWGDTELNSKTVETEGN